MKLFITIFYRYNVLKKDNKCTFIYFCKYYIFIRIYNMYVNYKRAFICINVYLYVFTCHVHVKENWQQVLLILIFVNNISLG